MRYDRSAGIRFAVSMLAVAVCAVVAAPGAARAICVLTCPADIAVDTENPQGAPVNYPTPMQAGCFGLVVQAQGLESGSVFPPGTTRNLFFDSVNTGSTCSFTVTVTLLALHRVPAAGPLGLAALAVALAGIGAWLTGHRRHS